MHIVALLPGFVKHFSCTFYCKTLTQHDRDLHPPDSTERRDRCPDDQLDRGGVDFASFEVMDGLLRISTVIDFCAAKFELDGLEIWSELNGRKYSKLLEKIKDDIDRRYLSSDILLNKSAKSREQADFLKKIVFERLNSGGVKLTPQETRNALYGGPFNRLCNSYLLLLKNGSCLNFHLRQPLFMIRICDFAFTVGINK